MSETTTIPWCHYTTSPWMGCSRKSEGCANCYIPTTTPLRRQHYQLGMPPIRTKSFIDNARRLQNRVWRARGTAAIQGRKLSRPRIFPSLCDWLDDQVPIDWLADFLIVLYDTSCLDWLLLTKRPENWRRRIDAAFHHLGERHSAMLQNPATAKTQETLYRMPAILGCLSNWLGGHESPANVWFGVTCENQQRADERIPLLGKIPARIRWLSCEPLLGPIDFKIVCDRNCAEFQDAECPGTKGHCTMRQRLDWVVAGGESGKGARSCNLDWLRSIRGQCLDAGVPVFIKQLGSNSWIKRSEWHNSQSIRANDIEDGPLVKLMLTHPKGADPAEWPEDLRIQQYPNL